MICLAELLAYKEHNGHNCGMDQYPQLEYHPKTGDVPIQKCFRLSNLKHSSHLKMPVCSFLKVHRKQQDAVKEKAMPLDKES